MPNIFDDLTIKTKHSYYLGKNLTIHSNIMTGIRLFILTLICLGYPNISSAAEVKNATRSKDSNNISKVDISQQKWLIVLNDPRAKRQQGWKNSQYRQSDNYQNNLAFKRLTQSMLKEHPIHLITEWPIQSIKAHCLVVTLPERDQSAIIARLNKDNRVKWVQQYQSFEGKSQQLPTPIKKRKPTSQIDKSDPYINLQANVQQLNISEVSAYIDGKGVSIAMIDSGVDESHPDLQGVLKEQIDFVDSLNNTTPGEHHGTGIAGVIAAKKNNGHGIVGIATGANLYAYRGCWETKNGKTHCDTLTLAKALNRVAELKPDILNLSLTGPKDRLLESITQEILKNGTQIIAAYDHSRQPTERFPLRQNGIIFVEDISQQLKFKKTQSSNPIYFAPGYRILTTQPGNTYEFISGSSMATANVSSLFALVKQIVPSTDLNQFGSMISKNAQANQPFIVINDACLLIKQFKHSNNCQ